MVLAGGRITHNNTIKQKTMFENYNKQEEAEQKALFIADVMHRFPDNPEIWKWWKTQKFQKEQGEQEHTMIYEIDLPKILKAFTEHLLNVGGQSEQLCRTFFPDGKTTSATKCQFCGKEKWEH